MILRRGLRAPSFFLPSSVSIPTDVMCRLKMLSNLTHMFRFIFVFWLASALSAQPAAKDVLQRAERNQRGNTSEAELIIRTIRPSWKREIVLQTWLKGDDLALLRIVSPPRDRGIVYLKRKKEVWNWIPALERVIKLPPSMMGQDWMGTDFTHDDLVHESSIVQEYTHSFDHDTLIGGRDCYMIRCVPLPTTAVIWGLLRIAIDKGYELERYVEFYDETGQKLSYMIADSVRELGGRLIPTRLYYQPLDKPGQHTEILYRTLRFDHPISDAFFSLDRIRQLQ